MNERFVFNDGGRSQYFKGADVRDCVTRALAIAAQRDYMEVYNLIKKVSGTTPRNGVKKRVARKVAEMLGGQWHPEAGKPTFFKEKVCEALLKERYGASPGLYMTKYHTIRGNYDLWRKRFEKINRGEACLVLKQWSGVPYRSKQETIAVLTKEDGIGLQKMEFYNGCLQQPILSSGLTIRVESLAKNDGLSFEDWRAWFKSYDITKPLAIIQFTKFRY